MEDTERALALLHSLEEAENGVLTVWYVKDRRSAKRPVGGESICRRTVSCKGGGEPETESPARGKPVREIQALFQLHIGFESEP